MRNLVTLAALAAIALASTAKAVELNYKWKVGDVHRFHYADDTTFQMAMGGMPGMGMMPGMSGGAGMRVQFSSDFSEKVLDLLPNGSAGVELTIDKLALVEGGRSIPLLGKIPPADRHLRAVIDRKGHARFERMVTLYMKDNRVLVGVSAQANGTGMQATGSAGGETVQVVASVDPKTGRVTASANVRRARAKAQETAVEVKSDDPGEEVVPRRILKMMELPDGDIAPGTTARMTSPMGTITFALSKMDGAVAPFEAKLAGNKIQANDQGVTSTDASGQNTLVGFGNMQGMGSMGGGMQAGGMGQPSGGMPMGGGMQQGGMGQAGAGMQMDCDIKGRFDTGRGELLGLSGSMHSDMSMGGMGDVKVKSKFQLHQL